MTSEEDESFEIKIPQAKKYFTPLQFILITIVYVVGMAVLCYVMLDIGESCDEMKEEYMEIRNTGSRTYSGFNISDFVNVTKDTRNGQTW